MSKKATVVLLEGVFFFVVFVVLAVIAHFAFDISPKGFPIVVIATITYLLVPRLQVVQYQSGEKIVPHWFLSKFRQKTNE